MPIGTDARDGGAGARHGGLAAAKIGLLTGRHELESKLLKGGYDARRHGSGLLEGRESVFMTAGIRLHLSEHAPEGDAQIAAILVCAGFANAGLGGGAGLVEAAKPGEFERE